MTCFNYSNEAYLEAEVKTGRYGEEEFLWLTPDSEDIQEEEYIIAKMDSTVELPYR